MDLADEDIEFEWHYYGCRRLDELIKDIRRGSQSRGHLNKLTERFLNQKKAHRSTREGLKTRAFQELLAHERISRENSEVLTYFLFQSKTLFESMRYSEIPSLVGLLVADDELISACKKLCYFSVEFNATFKVSLSLLSLISKTDPLAEQIKAAHHLRKSHISNAQESKDNGVALLLHVATEVSPTTGEASSVHEKRPREPTQEIKTKRRCKEQSATQIRTEAQGATTEGEESDQRWSKTIVAEDGLNDGTSDARGDGEPKGSFIFSLLAGFI